MSSLKRPRQGDESPVPQKKPRSNAGSPAPASNGAPPGKPDISKIMADARARAAAVAARLQEAKGTSTPLSTGLSPGTPSTGLPTSMADRLAYLKSRVNAAAGKGPTPPKTSASPTPTYQPPQYGDDGPARARGGLDGGLHPLLMGDSGADSRYSNGRHAVQSKFPTTMANRRTESPAPTKSDKGKNKLDLSGPSLEEIKANPYYDPRLGGQTATAKGRSARQLIFNEKGKYVAQAAALRRQALLEKMKKSIAEQSRKAGIDEDLELEKAFLVPAPPAIEWWDEGLVLADNYESIEDPAALKIDTQDSIITKYVQHPILIEPPQEKNIPAPKPMYLTAKEQAKLRRQRRMADLKEEQAKIRLGLEPAPPPKVKKGNLMRVLGEEAVKDPTAVEARVNREIAAREDKHEQTNQERKLTKEQKHEKLAINQEKDAQKGIYSTVYRIDNLANGKHRFKVSKNAEQMALTGVCILNPNFNLVIVEGGFHSIADYKKLMLNRIDWTENAPTRKKEGEKQAEDIAAWVKAEDENGDLKDLSLNRCVLVWEGELKTRAFKKWQRGKPCETDTAAKNALTRAKMENMWTLAKSK
jgi:U4/U6 small nuclear ribonucleoprotein PRP3